MLRSRLNRNWRCQSIFIFAILSLSYGRIGYTDALPEQVAIKGYSPVSYFENGFPELGSPQFSAEYDDKTYYFTSSDQVDKFKNNPEKYRPLFDACPYSLTLGRKVSIDPTRFKIIAGQLLLFHKSEEMDALQQWNEQDDDEGLLNKARRQYKFFQSRPFDSHSSPARD
ncbi:MAG: YHS domain-containing (seleno)protein [Gammaproteobacteria bacterium]